MGIIPREAHMQRGNRGRVKGYTIARCGKAGLFLARWSFGQKTPMRHFRGDYGPTTVRSLSCNLPSFGPYSPPVRDNNWGGMIHGLEATTDSAGELTKPAFPRRGDPQHIKDSRLGWAVRQQSQLLASITRSVDEELRLRNAY